MERKKNWTQSAVLVFCATLLVVNLWQGKRISELEQDIWNAQNSIMDNVSRVDQRLASLSYNWEHADDLVLNWEYSTSVDMEKRGLKVDITVDLKEWSEDTAVQVAWENLNGESLEGMERLTEVRPGSFFGTLELPDLERLREVTLDAVITNGDTQRQESLGWLGDVESLLPIQCASWGTGGPVYQKSTNQAGTVTLSSCDVDLKGGIWTLDQVTGCVFRLARNGETAVEQTAKQEDYMGSYGCEELSAEVQVGDELTLTFCCQDESGLGYEFFLTGWTVNEGGLQNRAPVVNYPVLTWN